MGLREDAIQAWADAKTERRQGALAYLSSTLAPYDITPLQLVDSVSWQGVPIYIVSDTDLNLAVMVDDSVDPSNPEFKLYLVQQEGGKWIRVYPDPIDSLAELGHALSTLGV